MKKSLLLLISSLCLGLASCAVTAAPGGGAPADPFAATLTLSAVEGQTYKALAFGSGTATALNVSLTLYGAGISVNDPACKAVDGLEITCIFKSRPANRTYTLYARNVTVATASYGREGGGAYTLTSN